MKSKIIVALVGMPGAGKTEAAKIFAKEGFQYLRFGQIVLDEAIRQGKVNEKTERTIRNGFRKKYGMGAMAILSMEKLAGLLRKGNVIIDDLYSWDEYKILKKKYGQRFVVVAVIASPKVRYARLAGRHYDAKKDKRAIYRPLTLAEAKSRDYDQIENADQGGPIAMADYYFVNDKGKENLVLQAKRLISLLRF